MKSSKIIQSIMVFSPVLLLSCNNVPEQPPNVLFIIVDDLNTTLGCYDHPVVKTPNTDRLAEKGILFRNAYCNYAVCNPSRSSFLTGLRPESIGVLDNRTTIQSKLGDKKTLPYLFLENGYYTVSIGKIFHGNNEHNDPKAWNEIHNFRATQRGLEGVGRNLTDGELPWCQWLAAEGTDEDQPDGQIAAKAVEFIKKDHQQPFFLAVGLHKPHDPFNAPKKYFDLYPIENCELPIVPENWEPPYSHTLPAGAAAIFNQFTDQERCEFLHAYYACVSFMDAQLGKIIDAMEEQGLMENTIIVFFGDHGYHLGEHNWWNKVTVYEKGHVAPMIISTGNQEVAGTETHAMIEFIDLYPTLASYCNLDIPDYIEGKDFGDVLNDPELSFRDYVNVIVNRGGFIGRSVKTREWRYTEWDDGERGTELYNQIDDPFEYNDLSDNEKYDFVQAEMQELIIYPPAE